MRHPNILCLFLFLLVFSGCVAKKPVYTRENALISSSAPTIQDDLKPTTLKLAIDQNIRYLKKLDPDKKLVFGNSAVQVSELIGSYKKLGEELSKAKNNDDVAAYIYKNFNFYKSAADSVLFTGYFEAELKGSKTKHGKYQHPLYRRPDDLVSMNLQKFLPKLDPAKIPDNTRARLDGKKVIPYFTRDEIDYQNSLIDKNLEMVWIDDPVDVFFLHIQGSGVVSLDNGKEMRVGYADKNGQPYRAIAKLLIDKGAFTKEEASMQAIHKYLEEHPEDMREVFAYNPSYIFFHEVSEGPIGSIGVPLTAERSIATDYRLFPKGALALIDTELPKFNKGGELEGTEKVSRLVVNQDTGGAIRGPGRVDILTGKGENAELVAGGLRSRGHLYFLKPKADLHSTAQP